MSNNTTAFYRAVANKEMTEQARKVACGQFGGTRWLDHIFGAGNRHLHVHMDGVEYCVDMDTGRIQDAEEA